jgi:DNA-binding MarR family transcriptional regulator
VKLEDALKTSKFRNPAHKASLNVLYTSYWLRTQFASTVKEIGMTMEQFNVMRILKGHHPQPMCVKDIASRMIERNSNVPRILDRLVAKKLVKRTVSRQDKRETLISLSDAGIEQLANASRLIDDMSDRTICISDADAAVLNEILDRLRAGEQTQDK